MALMSPDAPDSVRLLVACLYAPSADLDATRESLEARLGPVERTSQSWPFDVTDYYEPEMGPGLMRLFWSFEELIPPDRLPEIKSICTQIEPRPRTVNLDPMYLDHHKLLLASGKAAGQKVYLGQGIWGDIVLRFHQGGWSPLEWSFPDFVDERYHDFLGGIRRRYLEVRAGS